MNQKRIHIQVQGIVQGVGFRPFIYRIANQENLKGFVSNNTQGVEIEVEGLSQSITQFLNHLKNNAPLLSKITGIKITDLKFRGDAEFSIRASQIQTTRSTLISPDVSICTDCLRELIDPKDRRYHYPFINCTNCGPRYTIIQDIPYDRPKTTMSDFQMCTDCLREYRDPDNRRFHAQPNACPVCGPHIWLVDSKDQKMTDKDVIQHTVEYLKRGQIAAIKGLGGFHLACDAENESAVQRLRKRKNREEKPLAVMALDLSKIHKFAAISSHEKDMLLSPRRPIVLLQKHLPEILAPSIAPGNPHIGVMLPYTPLHYLILENHFLALVMTSGNLSEEPIAIRNDEALRRLENIADVFLMHDRDIYLRSDDSVTRFVLNLPRPIRRSRGYVPVPVFLTKSNPPILSVGAELKNTLCYLKEDQAFISQHIGDLENVETLRFFHECREHLEKILEIKPQAIIHDMHPDYLSTQWARGQDTILRIAVQHHHAHIASCLAENGRDEKVIGLSLDGTGYGDDGRIWGGEILLADLTEYQRAGHFEYHPMPGGEKAIKEPWRMAIAYLYTALNRQAPISPEDFIQKYSKLPIVQHVPEYQIQGILGMIDQKLNTPLTSSLGRLFDGAAALVGLKERVAFEGQAAMEFEMVMENPPLMKNLQSIYNFRIREEGGVFIISPDFVILQIMDDVIRKISIREISLKFHRGLVQIFLDLCKKIRKKTKTKTVALSGGCFQNRFLLEHLYYHLTLSGFEVLTHSLVPTNDGGLSLGQAVVGAKRLEKM